MFGSGTAGRLFLIAPPVKSWAGTGRLCVLCWRQTIFLGWGPVKYEAINAAKSCLWPLIREGIVTSIVIFRQNN